MSVIPYTKIKHQKEISAYRYNSLIDRNEMVKFSQNNCKKKEIFFFFNFKGEKISVFFFRINFDIKVEEYLIGIYILSYGNRKDVHAESMFILFIALLLHVIHSVSFVRRADPATKGRKASWAAPDSTSCPQ